MKHGGPLASLLFNIALNKVLGSSVSKGKILKCVRIEKENIQLFRDDIIM